MQPALRFLLMLTFAALASGCPTVVWADGPHWHVPNPDPDSGEDEEEEKKDEKPENPIQQMDMFNGSYNRCPGDFNKMDAAVRMYYTQHCSIRGHTDGKKIYSHIMHRCAQAMREVDAYLPCPDSYPLWHTERRRERMVKYAQRTWLKISQLPPNIADDCVALAVECYIDSVRFSNDLRTPPANIKNFASVHKHLCDTINKMTFGTNPAERTRAQMEWYQLGNRYNAMARGLSSTYRTFDSANTTGDLPLLVDDGTTRMRETIAKMGFVAIPALERHANHTNKDVQKLVVGLIEQIRSTYRDAKYDNVVALLKSIERRPDRKDSTYAVETIKAMGNAALPILIAAIDGENTTIDEVAFNVLAAITGKKHGKSRLAWKDYVDSVVPPAPKNEAAEAEDETEDAGKPPRKKALVPLTAEDRIKDMKEDVSDNFEIKKRANYDDHTQEE